MIDRLLASFAVKEFGDLEAEITITDELIERLNAALQSSSEGQFLAHAESGVLEKTKHVGLYRDNRLINAVLHADHFNESDVVSIFQIARRAIGCVADQRMMRAGRAIYETMP
jgi:hypothetical protein